VKPQGFTHAYKEVDREKREMWLDYSEALSFDTSFFVCWWCCDNETGLKLWSRNERNEWRYNHSERDREIKTNEKRRKLAVPTQTTTDRTSLGD